MENRESFLDTVMADNEPIVNPEIAELEAPLQKIIEELGPRLKTGEYGLFIGDDASGRIPTTIIQTIAKEIYRDHNLELPKTIFVAGSGAIGLFPEEERKKLRVLHGLIEQAKKMLAERSESQRRTLVITDTIVSGNSLKPLAETMKEFGLDHDFAAVGFSGSEQSRVEKEKILGGHIIFGKDLTPSIYLQRQLSGIKKHPDELHGVRWVDIYPAGAERAGKQQMVNQARADAAIVARRILKKYRQNYPQNL